MAIERASMRVVGKPWGSTDLRPWCEIDHGGVTIGEIWFQRADINAPAPALLLKLLFTQEPLSIQVHPDDTIAQSMGLAFGKTEAWYVLAAKPGATIAIGLKRRFAVPDLRASIEDGSIVDMVQWRRVLKGDVIFVPAGTIHAIGAGLVVAEIQQNSDATFRLFDHGRHRELHLDNAVAAAHAGTAACQPAPQRLTDARIVLVASPHFVLERIDLAPHSSWELDAAHETWILVLEGHGRLGPMGACAGEAIFLDADRTSVNIGAAGLTGLVAYLGPDPIPGLLHNLDGQDAGPALQDFSQPPPDPGEMVVSPVRSMEAQP
jgi:mannose-6-phosphate isomerase